MNAIKFSGPRSAFSDNGFPREALHVYVDGRPPIRDGHPCCQAGPFRFAGPKCLGQMKYFAEGNHTLGDMLWFPIWLLACDHECCKGEYLFYMEGCRQVCEVSILYFFDLFGGERFLGVEHWKASLEEQEWDPFWNAMWIGFGCDCAIAWSHQSLPIRFLLFCTGLYEAPGPNMSWVPKSWWQLLQACGDNLELTGTCTIWRCISPENANAIKCPYYIVFEFRYSMSTCFSEHVCTHV